MGKIGHLSIKSTWGLFFLFLIVQLSSFLHSDVDWSPPTNLSSTGDIFLQQVAFNDAGQAIAIWEAMNETGLSLFYATYHNENWSPPQILTEANAITGIDLAIDQTGKGIATWQQIEPNIIHSTIQAAVFDGHTWGPITELAKKGTGTLSWTRVVMNSTGIALVAWADQGGKLSSCFYKKNGWTPITTLTTNLYFQSQNGFDIDISANETAIAAWLNTNNIVETKTYNGSIWSPTTTHLSTSKALTPNLITTKMTNSIHPMVAWAIEGDEENFLQVARYNSGWQPADTIGGFGNTDLFIQLSLAMNTQGEALALWGGSDGTLKATSFKEGVWSQETVLSSSFSSFGNIQVCLNNLGFGEAFWIENTYTLKTNYFNGSGWSATPSTLSPTVKYQSSGALALNNKNQLLALWINGENFQGENQVLSASAEECAELYPSNRIQIKATRFSLNSFIQIEWASSPHSEIKKYALYRNNFLIAHLPASEDRYTDAPHTGLMIYQIDAFNESNQVIASGETYTY